MKPGVCRRYQLTEEVKRRTVRSTRGKGDRIWIDISELMVMVARAHVMVVVEGDTPDREGATVLMRGDISSAVQWVTNCKGGGKEEM